MCIRDRCVCVCVNCCMETEIWFWCLLESTCTGLMFSSKYICIIMCGGMSISLSSLSPLSAGNDYWSPWYTLTRRSQAHYISNIHQESACSAKATSLEKALCSLSQHLPWSSPPVVRDACLQPGELVSSSISIAQSTKVCVKNLIWLVHLIKLCK